MKSKDTEFAAVKLPKNIPAFWQVCTHSGVGGNHPPLARNVSAFKGEESILHTSPQSDTSSELFCRVFATPGEKPNIAADKTWSEG